MKKLLNLKHWLTVPDAARHLSMLLGEDVTEADVLRLALDGHLTLSVNFVNHTMGRCGRVVSSGDANWITVPSLSGDRQVRLPVSGMQIAEDKFLQLDKVVTAIDGVWDLTMLGAEHTDVEHKYYFLTGGPSVEDQTLEGPIVRREDGMHCQLLSHFSDNEFVNPNSLKEPRNHPANYYPAGGLPADSVLVVKTSALRDLEERLAEPVHKIEKPVEQRERTSLLAIIAAVAELAKLDVTKPSSAAVAIESQTVRMGVRVAARTIENHLKLIPEVLERLSK
jgi:hypothetical protein